MKHESKKITNTSQLYQFQSMLIDVLECANVECNRILDGSASLWELSQIQKIIIPEISELLLYARDGKVYFKYGKKQRLLESTFFLTDSLKPLSRTNLGQGILMLQKIYNQL
ncbi:MAG: hypothetical protein IJQ50_06500 [Clostridia bacterium]|nr:hypothetical protein [Clostridia bacterium]